MRQILSASVLLLFASVAIAQNSTTDTNCHGDGAGNGFNCTSTTKADTPPPNAFADVQKRLAEQRAARAATRLAKAELTASERAAQQAKQDQEDAVTANVIYCRENSTGSVGENKMPCADYLAQQTAFCRVRPDQQHCQLPASIADADAAFASLAEKYKYDARAAKKDCQLYYDSLFAKLHSESCMVYPDHATPTRDGSLQPCK
jgi:hypothetical protein